MPENDGGPAFPVPHDALVDEGGGLRGYVSEYCPTYQGMTLRDYFAAKAMQGYYTRSVPADNILWRFWVFLSGKGTTQHAFPDFECTSKNAYRMADAMLAAREAR